MCSVYVFIDELSDCPQGSNMARLEEGYVSSWWSKVVSPYQQKHKCDRKTYDGLFFFGLHAAYITFRPPNVHHETIPAYPSYYRFVGVLNPNCRKENTWKNMALDRGGSARGAPHSRVGGRHLSSPYATRLQPSMARGIMLRQAMSSGIVDNAPGFPYSR